MNKAAQSTKQLIHGLGELRQRIVELDSDADRSDQQRLQTALETMRDELEARVVERTANLQHANKRLQAEVVQRKQAEAKLRWANTNLCMAKDYAQNIINNSLDIIISGCSSCPFSFAKTVRRSLRYCNHLSNFKTTVGSLLVKCGASLREQQSYLMRAARLEVEDLGITSQPGDSSRQTHERDHREEPASYKSNQGIE